MSVAEASPCDKQATASRTSANCSRLVRCPARFSMQPDRLLADPPGEFDRPCDDARVGSFAADHFDQRDQVCGMKGMHDHDALGMYAVRLQLGGRDAAGA